MKNLRLKAHCWCVAGLGFKVSPFFLTSSSTVQVPSYREQIEKYNIVGKGTINDKEEKLMLRRNVPEKRLAGGVDDGASFLPMKFLSAASQGGCWLRPETLLGAPALSQQCYVSVSESQEQSCCRSHHRWAAARKEGRAAQPCSGSGALRQP